MTASIGRKTSHSPTCTESGVGYLPTKPSSFHSKMTTLTIGSPSPSGVCFSNRVEMYGSISPPQDFRPYMPEHRCVLPYFWSWERVLSVNAGTLLVHANLLSAAHLQLRLLRRPEVALESWSAPSSFTRWLVWYLGIGTQNGGGA